MLTSVTAATMQDYISIPQTASHMDAQETAQVLAAQARAIDAIPEYVQHARNFWVCAPSGAVHVDKGESCNYATWHARGWCRMEEAVLNLVRLGDGRPVESPLLRRACWCLLVHSQRHSSTPCAALAACRSTAVLALAGRC